MTDQTIPADEVRKIIAFYRDGASDRGGMILDALHALLPTPPRPTLADMTEEARRDCQWMQADVVNRRVRYVIANPLDDDEDVGLIDHDGDICWLSPDLVTPRPDLPRMEWPGTEKPTPALPDGWRLAEHKDHGRVIVTNPTPTRDGDVYFVIPAENPLGYDWYLCAIDELTFLDTGREADTSDTGREADTSDTVPPNTLSEGSVWSDSDALAEACEESGRDQIVVLDRAGGAYVWDEWWEGSVQPRFAPYTIIHAGKKADQ